MNPLTDIVPAKWRQGLYALFALAGLAVGIGQIIDPTAHWVDVAAKVVAYLSIAFGATAASNTHGFGARKDSESPTGYVAGNDGPKDMDPGEPATIEGTGVRSHVDGT